MKNLRNKILSTLAAFFFAVTPSFATVDFLWDNSGTNGQITSTLTLLSTELNSLANAAVIHQLGRRHKRHIHAGQVPLPRFGA